MFTCIYSLLIDKDLYESRKLSNTFPSVLLVYLVIFVVRVSPFYSHFRVICASVVALSCGHSYFIRLSLWSIVNIVHLILSKMTSIDFYGILYRVTGSIPIFNSSQERSYREKSHCHKRKIGFAVPFYCRTPSSQVTFTPILLATVLPQLGV